MKFAVPLSTGRLIRRYKRFLADVQLDDGPVITAACPNTGTMLGLNEPGARVWLSTSDSQTRKYRYTWEMIETDAGRGPTLVGINPSRPNSIVAETIAAGQIPELSGYQTMRREVRYGVASRIDLLLEGATAAPPCYVEIKNVHLMRKPGLAEFPDSRTERGAKHLRELADMARSGCRAVMVFLAQRADAEEFAVAGDIDPAYAAAFRAARTAGVEMLCYRCVLSPDQILVERRIPARTERLAIASERHT